MRQGPSAHGGSWPTSRRSVTGGVHRPRGRAAVDPPRDDPGNTLYGLHRGAPRGETAESRPQWAAWRQVQGPQRAPRRQMQRPPRDVPGVCAGASARRHRQMQPKCWVPNPQVSISLTEVASPSLPAHQDRFREWEFHPTGPSRPHQPVPRVKPPPPRRHRREPRSGNDAPANVRCSQSAARRTPR